MSSIKEKMQEEQDILEWQELVRHFAFGRLFYVSPKIDLSSVAEAMANDNTSSIKEWMEQKLCGLPSDDQAKVWDDKRTKFRVNIVSPFVVVQEICD